MQPKVSVIVPVYNVEQYLRQCLDSLINQTLKDIEIICVNDGSTDNSLEILQSYAKQDDRIKVINQENGGAGSARNKGMIEASGKCLYFIDGDDYLQLDALEKIYQKIADTNADICVFKNNIYRQSSRELMPCNWERFILNISNKEIFNKYDISKVFFQFCNIPVWSKMYRTSFIKDNKIEFQNLRTCNDVYFNYVSLILASSITFLNKTLLTWRTEHCCTTATRGKYVYNILEAYKAVKNKLSKEDLSLLHNTFYKAAKHSFNYEISMVEDNRKDYLALKFYWFLPFKYWIKKATEIFARKIFSVQNLKIHKIGIRLKI